MLGGGIVSVLLGQPPQVGPAHAHVLPSDRDEDTLVFNGIDRARPPRTPVHEDVEPFGGRLAPARTPDRVRHPHVLSAVGVPRIWDALHYLAHPLNARGLQGLQPRP